jgi:hypothetical protein
MLVAQHMLLLAHVCACNRTCMQITVVRRHHVPRTTHKAESVPSKDYTIQTSPLLPLCQL